jgi:hypothetical protein
MATAMAEPEVELWTEAAPPLDGEHGGDAKCTLCDTASSSDGEQNPEETLCRPVYEASDAALLGRYLVMTPWMLLDRLKECQDEAEAIRDSVYARGLGAERRFGRRVNPLAERVDRLSGEINHILQLLWRGGLWTDGPVEERASWDGGTYQVLREPFTDGKPHGRPLPPDAPDWQRELLGLPTAAKE